MERDFEFLLEKMSIAASCVRGIYMNIPTAGNDYEIYRERVYCYELYHQLRLQLGDSFDYTLYGEIDKKRHGIIAELVGDKKPDFVVHDPGNMKRNLAIIEVKPVSVVKNLGDLKNDLNKTLSFMNKAKYLKGIQLVYGNGETDLPNEILEKLRKTIPKTELNFIFLWHKGPKLQLKIGTRDDNFILK